MNRRSFFRNIIGATAAFTILPGATTYKRAWKAVESGLVIPNPLWEKATFQLRAIWHTGAISVFSTRPEPKVIGFLSARDGALPESEIIRYHQNLEGSFERVPQYLTT